MEKKKQLASALREERDRLSLDGFGGETDFAGIDLAIRYLETGEYSQQPLG